MLKRHIVLHHTADDSEGQQYQKVWDYHNRRWYQHGIAYHYFIERSGFVIQGRRENSIGYHCGRWMMNVRSIGVCLAGDFTKEKPTDKQIETLANLLTWITERRHINWRRCVHLHWEIKPTACPGVDLRDLAELHIVEAIEKLTNDELYLPKRKKSSGKK